MLSVKLLVEEISVIKTSTIVYCLHGNFGKKLRTDRAWKLVLFLQLEDIKWWKGISDTSLIIAVFKIG